MRRAVLALAASALVLQACATAPKPTSTAAAVVAPAAWRADQGTGAAVQPGWWRAFGDPVLTQLVETAVANNTDIAVATARVEEARAQTRVSRAALLPTLDLEATGGRSRALDAFGSVAESGVAQPQLRAAYEVDLWGRLRDQDRAARASLQASEAARDAAALSVAGATASGYLTLRALDARLVTVRQTVAARQDALRLARSRAQAGYTSQLELHQAESEYQAAAQLLPQAQLAVTRQENALRVLLGETPGEVPRGAALAALTPPPVPAALPSELLRRRPDIAQAEAQVVAADSSYAAARAQMLPQVRLTAAVGDLFIEGLPNPIGTWNFAGSILSPLFDGGRLQAQADAAGSRRDQAAFGYRKTALTAFREVEDAMAAVRRLTELEMHARLQRDAAAQTLRVAHNRYQAGYASYLEELDAQRTLLSAELTLVQAQGDALNASVALYQALGGGWAPA